MPPGPTVATTRPRKRGRAEPRVARGARSWRPTARVARRSTLRRTPRRWGRVPPAATRVGVRRNCPPRATTCRHITPCFGRCGPKTAAGESPTVPVPVATGAGTAGRSRSRRAIPNPHHQAISPVPSRCVGRSPVMVIGPNVECRGLVGSRQGRQSSARVSPNTDFVPRRADRLLRPVERPTSHRQVRRRK